MECDDADVEKDASEMVEILVGELLFEASAALEPWEDKGTGGEGGEEGLCTGRGKFRGYTKPIGSFDIKDKPPGLCLSRSRHRCYG